MMRPTRMTVIAGVLALAALTVHPEESSDAVAPLEDTPKTLSGMSILGNNEAPKSLVIVPWKTSKISDGVGLSNLLDSRAQPVDKDVFLRELSYYELRAATPSEASSQSISEALAGADAGEL